MGLLWIMNIHRKSCIRPCVLWLGYEVSCKMLMCWSPASQWGRVRIGVLGKATVVGGLWSRQCLTFDELIEGRRQGLTGSYWRHTLEIQHPILPSHQEVRTLCHVLPLPRSPASPETQSTQPTLAEIFATMSQSNIFFFFSTNSPR